MSEKRAIIESVEALLDGPVASFCSLFLAALDLSDLRQYTPEQWSKFLIDRYGFFEQGVAKKGQFWVHPPHEAKVHHRWSVDLIYPNASNLFFTLQTLLREFDIKVTMQLHPMVAVQMAGTAVSSVSQPVADSTSVYSVVYIEFEEIPADLSVGELSSRIEMHMQAVQIAHHAQSDMASRAKELKGLIPSVEALPAVHQKEWMALLDWLYEDNFFFYGYVAYDVDPAPKSSSRVRGSGLGLLSDAYSAVDQFDILSVLDAQVQKKLKHAYLFYFDTINAASPVQRFARMMRLSFKIPVADGHVVEHNFVGIMRRSSLHVKNSETPLIHRKMKHIFETKQMLPGSHDYNEVIRIFTGIPKYELFRSSKETLLEMVERIFSITNPNRVHCFTKAKPSFNTFHVFIVLPPYVFSRRNIGLIQAYLAQTIPHHMMELTEVYDPDKPRLHVYFECDEMPTVDQLELESAINEMVTPWEDRVKALLFEQFPPSEYAVSKAEQLYAKYIGYMPSYYRVRTSPEEVVRDIRYLEQVQKDGEIRVNLERFLGDNSRQYNKVSTVFAYTTEKIRLIDIMPILENFGLVVLDQVTTRIGSDDTILGHVQSYRVMDRNLMPLDEESCRELIKDGLTEVFHKRAENDPLNQLMLTAKLSSRQVRLIRTLRNLYLQLKVGYSKESVTRVLVSYPASVRHIYDYFDTKFNPDDALGSDRDVLLATAIQDFESGLADVSDVVDDTILRHIKTLVDGMLRTNFYQHSPVISVKLASREIPFMPTPVPYREIFVNGVCLEGTHLRYGPVSRGGLRWSSRPDDFRVEVLGLVKTQQTKNVVIVPAGSKGGFVVKPEGFGVEMTPEFVQDQYKAFIGALLDITDNRDDKGAVVRPDAVVAYDGDDPYLVVAADKGTATFSDLANSVSEDRGFWLGDAFASGGSVGYDHKKEGITARGAWECVKLHFFEMGKDCQSEPFTAVGVGDMSGDVFGNGMLLSPVTRLQAAFNHLHIFVDPDPDPSVSYKERKRLFELPRSMWTDYDASLISSGGGVFERKAKSIPVSPEMAALFGIEADTVSGAALINYILKAPVELMWFGGIGTYIKSPSESHLDVGDPGNDSCRVDVDQVQAKIMGEGANLGITQQARIELSEAGCRLNSDAIDNSAGVNMSDYEVNLKILFKQLLDTSVLADMSARNELLARATDGVSACCLANNQAQHRLISMELLRSATSLNRQRVLVSHLVESVGLDLEDEAIPDEPTLARYEQDKLGLTRPVLGKLQAYAKMDAVQAIESLPAHAHFSAYYLTYFPELLRDEVGDHLDGHPLKSDILIMSLVNHVINHAGSTFFVIMAKFTNRSYADILQAYMIGELTFNAVVFRQKVRQLPAEQQYQVLIEFEDILAEFVEDLLRESSLQLSLDRVADYQQIFALYESFVTTDMSLFDVEPIDGIPFYPSYRMARDVIYLHRAHRFDVDKSVAFMAGFESVFALDWLKKKLLTVVPQTHWEQSEQEILRHVIDVKKISLINRLAPRFKGNDVLGELVVTNQVMSEKGLADYKAAVSQLKSATSVGLTPLSVVLNMLGLVN